MNTETNTDLLDPPECILECASCNGTSFALGERGSVWCKTCHGQMNVMVGTFMSSPQPLGADCVGEA